MIVHIERYLVKSLTLQNVEIPTVLPTTPAPPPTTEEPEVTGEFQEYNRYN